MKISDLSVDRPVTTIVVYLAIVVLGIFSLGKLAIDLIPDISFPVIAIFSRYTGAAPEEVEENLTKAVENAASSASNIEKISSNSSEGNSIVIIEYKWGTDMTEAAADLREKLDLIRDFIPDDASQPTLFKFDPSMMPIMILTVQGKRNLENLRYIAENDIKYNLEQIDGVASVQIMGGLETQIHVDLDRALLASYSLSIDQVINIVRAENMNITGGSVDEGSMTYMVRTLGKFKNLDEIKHLIVANNKGKPIYLSDVANVYSGYKDSNVDVKIDRDNAIVLAVQKQSGTNTVQIAKKVENKIKNLTVSLPEDVKMVKIYASSDFIKRSISDVWKVALMGSILAVLVLFAFLKNLPTTLIISVSIPLSIIITFIFMYFFGLTLNILSLGGLALGIGMLVDTSIVVIENIFRYREYGAKPIEAAKFGTQEMTNAIIASTLTTVVVFLPMVLFIKGMASELFKDLAFTVTFSLLSSLLVALTIIPMLSSKIKHVKIKERANSLRSIDYELQSRGKVLRFLDKRYKSVLGWSIKHKVVIVISIFVIFAASLFLIQAISVEFLPQSDEGQIIVNVKTPIGSSVDTTRKAVERLYNIVEENVPEKKSAFIQVGRVGEMMGRESSNSAQIWLTLVDLEKRKRSDNDIIEALRPLFSSVPGIDTSFSTNPGGAGMVGTSGLTVSVRGYDLKQGKNLADKIKGVMEKVKTIKDVDVSRKEGLPEYRILIDRDRAALFGLNTAQVGTTIKRAFAGEEAATVVFKGDEVGILLRFKEKDRIKSSDLDLISVATPYGSLVPLSNLVRIEKGYGPVTIEREGQQRVVNINANVRGDMKTTVAQIKESVSKLAIPSNFNIIYGGSWEDFQDVLKDLIMVLILSIILIYFIMAAQFESFFDPFIIMFTLPMTFIGVVWMHIITGTTFSAVSGIGVLVLTGIVVNNGIILVDYTNLLRKRGYDLLDAVILAGRTRLRPILMTMLTTVLGLIPMALGIGSASEMRAPMARTVIGGLLVSTIFTLVLIPTLYTIFEMRREKRRIKRLARVGGAENNE